MFVIWYETKKKEGCGKQDRNCLQWHCKPIERDVAQLGSAFVLGTKCHGFKSCHPYLITAQKSSNEESILDLSFFNKIGHTYNSEFYDILWYSIYVQNRFELKNVLFLAFSFFYKKQEKRS